MPNFKKSLPKSAYSLKIPALSDLFLMSRVCQLTGARPRAGHNVSHSNRKTNRRFLPNLLTKRLVDEATGLEIKVRMTARALRTMAKNPNKFKGAIEAMAKKALKKSLKLGEK